MLDNNADLQLTVSPLWYLFGFPTKFALRYMAPGAFFPLLELLYEPIVGSAALAIILTTLMAKVPLSGSFAGRWGRCWSEPLLVIWSTQPSRDSNDGAALWMADRVSLRMVEGVKALVKGEF